MAKKNSRPAKKAAPQEKKPAPAKKTAAKKTDSAKSPPPAKKTVAEESAPAKALAPAKKAIAERRPPSPAAGTEVSPSAPSAAANEPAGKADAGPTPPTTISAKVDIGFGNILYIRGEGPGLSWERGVPMDCVAADEWTWRTRSASAAFICKVLINDEIWSTGEDFHVPPGERLVCYPTF